MLNFVRMELRGFKSFADKVVIPFNEGVTAIIGPNGCGKSNVADAIRWTLGEKRAKQLRGKQMTDVIFAGTEKRKSLSYCEVTLVFNNENNHIFPGLGLDEVAITRKMDRSGRSEYFINNSHCRLQDITNLFSDTGAGKEGYSIIGQGKVAEIMSAKPEERRHIFEEAAEISGFRNNRTDSERKLEKAKLNMQTADEVIAEINRRLGPLRKQAEAAEKYNVLKEELKQLEVNCYIYGYENNQTIKQRILDRIAATKAELEKRETEYKIAVQKYEESNALVDGIDRLSEQQNTELMALMIAATRLEGDVALVKERINAAKQDVAELNEDINYVDGQLIATDKLIEAAQQRADESFARYLSKSKEAAELEERYKQLSASVEGKEEDIEARNRDYLSVIEELGELKANYSSYVVQRRMESERAERLDASLKESRDALNAQNTDLAIYEGKLGTSKESMRELVEQYNETLQSKLDAAEAKKAYEEDIVKLNSALGWAQSQLELLKQTKEQYSEYPEAVQHLLKDAKSDPNLSKKIWGVLAEVLKVPEEYVTAIDYALGGAMQHVLCESDNDAGELIEYLKRKGYGRATFRPYTSCRIHLLEGGNLNVLKEPGCLGLAWKLISYDKKFEPFVQALLGTTVIVNNMDNAKYLFRKYNQAFRIVTLSGEILTRAGEITGGSKRNQTSLLAKEQEIASLAANIEKQKKNIATMRSRLEDKDEEIKQCEESLQTLSAKLSELKIEIGLNESRLEQATANARHLTDEIAETEREYESAKATVDGLDEKINSIDRLEKLASEKKAEYTNLYEQTLSQGTQQRTERQEVQEQVMQMRILLATINSDIDRAKGDLKHYQSQRAALEEKKIEDIASLKLKTAELESLTSKAQSAVIPEKDAARIRELETEIAQLKERKLTLSDDIKKFDADKTRLFEEKNTLNGNLIRDESMLESVDVEIRRQQEHILEEYDLTYASSLAFKQENFDPEAANARIADVKRSIARLGDVNPLALEDLKQTEEHLNEQVALRDDILKAYNDLIKIIDELTDEMRDRFATAFEKINENFKALFKQLFGGGNGELRLSKGETDDVLEQGIEIYAQPPGKKLQNISLLSGGEQALTAIAILFAILKLKPMPFCVLDEIEAALDDGNVDLFGEFLKKFSDFTQFIVITHRKPTMRHADTIFGVTMEEKGVTKIVSVEFAEAEKSDSVQ